MTWKIALGVFLGVTAAFLVINSPAWIRQYKQEHKYDNEVDTMWNLTPELVIQRCGKPQQDVISGSGDRLMYYAKADVTLIFTIGVQASPAMSSGAPEEALGSWSPPVMWVKGDGSLGSDARAQLDRLPCLQNRSK